MVLDAKALTWAAQNNIDTAKLKAANVPIYGKWYFPEIPAGVSLVNLETGEQEVFAERMVAGEVIYVPATDLLRAGLTPEGFAVREVPAGTEAIGRGLRVIAPEPLLAMARPPGLEIRSTSIVPVEAQQALVVQDAADLVGIHMPSPSIAPFVLGVGFCITMLGAISNVIILIVGLLWMVAGAIGWVRIGLLESRAGAAHAAPAAAEVAPAP
jgi:hypothetical protein